MRLSELQAKPSDLATLRAGIASRSDYEKKYNSGAGADTDVFYSAVDAMTKYGFKLIGTGAKGTVFAKPGYPYVVKIFGDDSAYLDWLNFCKQHQSNPYVPQIKGKPIHIADGFYGIRLERLIRHNHAYGISLVLTGFVDQYPAIFEQQIPLNQIQFSPKIQMPLEYVEKFFPDYATDVQLKEAIKGIYDLVQHGHAMDIHNDNIMARGFASPQVVIIDALKVR